MSAMNHDIIVIGGSAGAMEVLLQTAAALPANLEAAVFVVTHIVPHSRGLLPDLLSARGPLPAEHPVHGAPFQAGHIYVAPPDNHLLLDAGRMRVVRGPKESGHRPAVDALFRTAAAAYGPRVVGVVLSGYQDCGTAGMMSIKARGGVSVVQSPETAQAPDMPRSVLTHVGADHVVQPAELAALIEQLSRQTAGAAMDPDASIQQLEGAEPGKPADIVCPSCNGVVTETEIGRFQHFRCHTGHTFTVETLLGEQNEELERALWAAVRALEESSRLSLRISGLREGELRARFAERAATERYEAELIRELLLRKGRRRQAA
jgi:two-component system chemotaxis response regulator CheB